MFCELADEAESTDFDSDSLIKETVFNYRWPWFIQIDAIRDYFGEKIAIYFRFISYYTFHLTYMSVIAIVVEILISLEIDAITRSVNIIFSIIIIVWSTLFIELWKR